VRVLFWSDTFWPVIGGVEVLGGRLARALKAAGHDLIIVSRRDSDDLPDEDRHFDIPLYRFPLRTALQARDMARVMELRRRLAGLVRAFDPQVGHIYHSGPGVYFYLQLAASRRLPALMTLHQTYVTELLEPDSMRGRLLRRARWVTACSDSVLSITRRQLPEITPRSSVVLNSLSMPAATPSALPYDPPRLLCVGRLIPQKGFDLALCAWARLAGGYPGARLVIAGDGLARADLERQAADLGLDSVEFLGWIPPDDVPDLINTCTLVIMPSRIEPLGLVAVQAAQMARPIVATRVDGLPEVVVDGQTGLLTAPDDVHGLAEAMQYLLEHPSIATAMGQAARRRAQEVFDWRAHVGAYDGLYRRLAAAPGPGVDGASS
jgi:glycogen(starch) synthase